MICKKVRLRNFRNTSDESVVFGDGINILYGENAQGKTNLLEALYYVSIGKSFRTSHENEVIRFSEDFASVSLDYEASGRDQNITIRFSDTQRKQIEHNGVKVGKLSELVGNFRAVLFCPEHLGMIKDGPTQRRNYLDVAISQTRPVYLYSLQKYYKILKQRNQLIKNAVTDKRSFDQTVDFWSEQLAHEAAIISKARYEYVLKTGEITGGFYKRMRDKGEIDEVPEFIYAGSSKQPQEEYSDVKLTEERYRSLLMSSHDREIFAGATLYGIHKDDIAINLNGKNTRLYASQGQQRSLALAMKLSEGEICKRETGEYPVYLFDDVFSELDGKRRKNLLSEIADKQVIITSCEKDTDFGLGEKKIMVKNGKYTY